MTLREIAEVAWNAIVLIFLFVATAVAIVIVASAMGSLN